MRSWRAVCLVAWAALPACGGQVHDVPDAGPAPLDAAVALSPCRAGDPPATLVTGLSASIFNGMATDGTRLYVAQGSAPLLWSMDVRGGPATTLYGSDVTTKIVSTSQPLALLPVPGGIFFDAVADSDEPLSWVGDTGGPVKTVSKASVTAFDPSGTRGFAWGGSVLSTVSLADGALTPYPVPPLNAPVSSVLATKQFVHVMLMMTTQAFLTDRRVYSADGSTYEQVDLPAADSRVLAGPDVVCGPATIGRGLWCLADGASTITFIPVAPSTTVEVLRYIDTDWIYASTSRDQPQLSRFSRADGHEEVLMAGASTAAVTSSGDCVYAAMVTDSGKPKASTAIWRFSPPR